MYKAVLVLCLAGLGKGYYRDESGKQQNPVDNPYHHDKKHVADYFARKDYRFQYAVDDPHNHDFKKQEETRKEDVVKGYYSFYEPDRTERIVHYSADKKNGFNAVVERKGHAAHRHMEGSKKTFFKHQVCENNDKGHPEDEDHRAKHSSNEDKKYNQRNIKHHNDQNDQEEHYTHQELDNNEQYDYRSQDGGQEYQVHEKHNNKGPDELPRQEIHDDHNKHKYFQVHYTSQEENCHQEHEDIDDEDIDDRNHHDIERYQERYISLKHYDNNQNINDEEPQNYHHDYQEKENKMDYRNRDKNEHQCHQEHDDDNSQQKNLDTVEHKENRNHRLNDDNEKKSEEQVVEYNALPKYEFQYAVHDPHTHDVKKQKETREGDVVEGYYSLLEPDGTERIVHYAADKKNGFNAVVERKGHAVHPPVKGSKETFYKKMPEHRESNGHQNHPKLTEHQLQYDQKRREHRKNVKNEEDHHYPYDELNKQYDKNGSCNHEVQHDHLTQPAIIKPQDHPISYGSSNSHHEYH